MTIPLADKRRLTIRIAKVQITAASAIAARRLMDGLGDALERQLKSSDGGRARRLSPADYAAAEIVAAIELAAEGQE